MHREPLPKRAIAFIDGQNLYHAAKEAFGVPYPEYDPICLSKAVCRQKSWHLQETRFYTGIPDRADNAFWNYFWSAKLGALGHRGAHVFSRPLRYRNTSVRLSNGRRHTFLVAEEKGIDVRIAVDIIRLAHQNRYDVALLFSQDQDLSEVAREIRLIAAEKKRWIKIASAFPTSPTSRNKRGVNQTDWIPIDRETYSGCVDPRDYRPPKSRR